MFSTQAAYPGNSDIIMGRGKRCTMHGKKYNSEEALLARSTVWAEVGSSSRLIGRHSIDEFGL